MSGIYEVTLTFVLVGEFLGSDQSTTMQNLWKFENFLLILNSLKCENANVIPLTGEQKDKSIRFIFVMILNAKHG